jgi:hypothetical protein
MFRQPFYGVNLPFSPLHLVPTLTIHDGSFYFFSADGVYRSTDGGHNFAKLDPVIGLPTQGIPQAGAITVGAHSGTMIMVGGEFYDTTSSPAKWTNYINTLFSSSDGISWSTCNPFGVQLACLAHSCSLLSVRRDGDGSMDLIVMIGGYVSSQFTNVIYASSTPTVTGSWVACTAPFSPRSYTTTCLIDDNSRILVLGGFRDATWSPTDPTQEEVWISNSNLDLTQWSYVAPLPFRRWGFAALCLNNHVFLFGGYYASGKTWNSDVWVSSDQGNSFLLVSANANYPADRPVAKSWGNRISLFAPRSNSVEQWVAEI